MAALNSVAVKTSDDIDEYPDNKQSTIEWATNAEKRQEDEASLWRWNMACGILHLVQAIAVLAIGLGSTNSAKFKLPLISVFTGWSTGYPVPAIQYQALLPFVAVTSGFSWMSAAAHFTVLFFFKTYIVDLRKGLNRFRWYEYAASSSLMIALIAMLFGIYDIISLVLIMSVNACMNFFGLIMEIHNQTTPAIDWTSFFFGCFAGATPWAVIFAYMGGGGGTSNIPGFVWGILVVYIVLFNTFPINMILQYLKVGKWSDETWGYRMGGYYYGEKVYQILSLVAKSFLVWLVVGGTNQPNAFIK